MHRRTLIVCIAAVLVFMTIAALVYSFRRLSDVDYRVARDRGAEYLSLHLYKAALGEFEQAVKLRPREADPLIGMAST